ncbi:hypothetical protein DFH06DRAFT_308508 [Mycena polygramma]|nr:hypothetical protein DFH06DRAFT_308508 [Mycena polygramma]
MDASFAVPHRWLSLTLSTKLLATFAQIQADALTVLESLDLCSTSAEELSNANVFLLANRLRRVTRLAGVCPFSFPPTSSFEVYLVISLVPRLQAPYCNDLDLLASITYCFYLCTVVFIQIC